MTEKSSRKVKSLRGEIVDFDLFEIKNKILNAPTPDTVAQRERFIDKKRRRGSRKKVDEMLAKQQANESAVRAALVEQRREQEAQKNAVPHVVIDDTIVTPPTNLIEGSDESVLSRKRKIQKTG